MWSVTYTSPLGHPPRRVSAHQPSLTFNCAIKSTTQRGRWLKRLTAHKIHHLRSCVGLRWNTYCCSELCHRSSGAHEWRQNSDERFSSLSLRLQPILTIISARSCSQGHESAITHQQSLLLILMSRITLAIQFKWCANESSELLLSVYTLGKVCQKLVCVLRRQRRKHDADTSQCDVKDARAHFTVA